MKRLPFKGEVKERIEKQPDKSKEKNGKYYISQSIDYPFGRLPGKIYIKVRGTERRHSEIEV